MKADVQTALMRLDDMGAHLDSRLRENDRIRCSRMLPGVRGCGSDSQLPKSLFGKEGLREFESRG